MIDRHRTAVTAVLLLAGGLAAAGCSPPSVELQETQSFRAASHTQTVEAQVGSEAKSIKLSFDLEVDEGTVAFHVRDPLGAVRWQGELSAGGQLSDSRDFPATEGPWRLDIDLQAASGHYKARWIGR